MSQTAKILKMKSLGFTWEQIATQLHISIEELKEILRQHDHPSAMAPKRSSAHGQQKRKDRPPLSRIPKKPVQVIPVQEVARTSPVLEVKPGFYVLTADDLLNFASRLHEHLSSPRDPYQDYVQKDVFQKEYGISTTTLQRHLKEGLLKVYRLGNKQYLKKSQVVEALEKGKL